jgi:phospholipase/lecithinase/hemolysin
MPPLRRIAPLLLAVAAAAVGNGRTQSAAAAYTDLVVFGDSLSDMGNIMQATLGTTPGSHYYQGRFSNGPTWVETLSPILGQGTLGRSTAGGDDFAYGGAQTTGSGGLAGLFIRDLDEQVTQFLGSRTASPTALYVVWAGANDLLTGQSNVDAPAAKLVSEISRLVGAGARQLLVPNLPLLGYTPRFNGDAAQLAQNNARSAAYNAAVDARLATLAATNLALTIHRLDVASLVKLAIDNPAAFGLTNVVDSAAPGLTAGAVIYDDSRVAANPNEYLFWDDIHPTASVHATLANYAKRLLDGVVGDLDTNGVVAADDLALWRLGLGVSQGAALRQGDASGDGAVDGADFLLWQRNLGTNVIALPTQQGVQAVPEVLPAWWAMMIAWLMVTRTKHRSI